MKRKEITIIGAGLAGMTAAIVLARKGYRPVVKEMYKEIGRASCRERV